ALDEGLARVDDRDEVEIALATHVASGEGAEEQCPPHAESRQCRHDALELCLEPSPATLARPPVHHLSDLRPAPDRHDAEYTVRTRLSTSYSAPVALAAVRPRSAARGPR